MKRMLYYITNGKWWALLFNSDILAIMLTSVASSGTIITLFGICGLIYTLRKMEYHINSASLHFALLTSVVGILMLLMCGAVCFTGAKLFNRFLNTK